MQQGCSSGKLLTRLFIIHVPNKCLPQQRSIQPSCQFSRSAQCRRKMLILVVSDKTGIHSMPWLRTVSHRVSLKPDLALKPDKTWRCLILCHVSKASSTVPPGRLSGARSVWSEASTGAWSCWTKGSGLGRGKVLMAGPWGCSSTLPRHC